MGKLVVIDGNAILHRAYHALPPLTTRRGEPINAVYGLISMLLKVIADLKPEEIAVCFDEKEPTFRHKEFKQYQAQRPQTANELSGQFEKARRVINAFGIPVYSKPGFEADDVIGTLASQSKEDVVIVTGDRDILQLVNSKVKVYMPVSGMSEGKLMGKDEVVEKMGVVPELIPDYKALVGDPSDNYPGVPGVGPKTAINLLNEFGSVSEVYKNLKKISPKLSEKLEQGKDSAEMSHRLATIVKDVPVKLDEEAASRWDVDNKKVLDVFADFGFKTLTERVKKVGKQMDEEKQMSLI